LFAFSKYVAIILHAVRKSKNLIITIDLDVNYLVELLSLNWNTRVKKCFSKI